MGDALELLQEPSLNPVQSDGKRRHLRGAMYLAGYAVEFSLKAYLIAMHHPLRTLSAVDLKLRRIDPNVPNLVGSAGHNISAILSLTDLEVSLDDFHRKRIGIVVSKWHPNMRYNPLVPKKEDATELVYASRDVLEWIVRRI